MSEYVVVVKEDKRGLFFTLPRELQKFYKKEEYITLVFKRGQFKGDYKAVGGQNGTQRG